MLKQLECAKQPITPERDSASRRTWEKPRRSADPKVRSARSTPTTHINGHRFKNAVADDRPNPGHFGFGWNVGAGTQFVPSIACPLQ
jgi:hypothetical protein